MDSVGRTEYVYAISNETGMKIEAAEDYCGDPCYFVSGHVNIDAFRAALSSCSDFGEDDETASGYIYQHAHRIVEPNGRWRLVPAGTGGEPITLAALWSQQEGR